jgi:hypothetical protein
VKKKKAATLVVGNGESVERRPKEEVVAKRSHDACDEGRPEPVAHRNPNHHGDKDEIDILDAKPRLNELADAERRTDRDKRHDIRAGLKGSVPSAVRTVFFGSAD